MFVHAGWDWVYNIHTDDFLAAGPPDKNKIMLLEMIGQEMLLKVGAPLPEEGSLAKFENFLSRERSRRGDLMLPHVSSRYVEEAAALVGLSDAHAASTPSVTDRKKRNPGADDDPELRDSEKSLFRSVVGKLLWVQEDYAKAS